MKNICTEALSTTISCCLSRTQFWKTRMIHQLQVLINPLTPTVAISVQL